MRQKSLLTTAVATVVLMRAAAAAQGNSAAEEFGATAGIADPILTTNMRPALCNRVLADASQLFRSTEADLDIAASIASDLAPQAMQPAITGVQSEDSVLSRADLDLDNNGHREVIIYRNDPFNSNGNWHYAYVFPSIAAYEAVKDRIAAVWVRVPDSQVPNPSALTEGAQQYYPSALNADGQEIQTGDVWADHSFFEFEKAYYFAAGTTSFDRERPTPAQIFRLRGDGRVELTCQIEQQNVDRAYAAFTRLPAVGALLSVIRTMGAGGDDGGTLHSGETHDAQATAAEVRAASRPWATSAETTPAFAGAGVYYRYDQRTRDFLEEWSLQELWDRREYQTFQELIAPAEASYAAYLHSAFGVAPDMARLDSIQVIQQLIGARFEVPSQFNTQDAWQYFVSTPLHRAVMLRDKAAFDRALANPQQLEHRTFAAPKPAEAINSDSLPDAVEWSYALDRLLLSGANPDQPNTFGKTPLMVAAHFDRADAVRRLLKAGAAVNASTNGGSPLWGNSMKRTGRTALMYAAENAGPAVLEALLQAGADPNARDSVGNGMDFYLANNPRYSAADRALGVTGLAKIAAQFAGPSFSCAKARTATERSICDSETLRILDADIARAFGLLRQRGDAAVLAEQRAWLRVRDGACVPDRDADCLAELMRTHRRYLFERLAESGSPVKNP